MTELTSISFPDGIRSNRTEAEVRASRVDNLVSMIEVIARGAAQAARAKPLPVKGSPTYISWQSMRARCHAPSRQNRDWAKAGVAVCDRWDSYENFLEDMGERPEGKTLDRYPNHSGNYEPGNCRWATPREQARNTRKNVLDYDTAVQVAVERLLGARCQDLAEQYGISESLPREIVAGRCWRDARDDARRQLGMVLACPWCNADPKLPANVLGRYVIECENDNCIASVSVAGDTPSDAVSKWNRRAL